MSYSQPPLIFFFFFFNDTATTEIYTLSLHDALPIFYWLEAFRSKGREELEAAALATFQARMEQYGLRGKCVLYRSEEHTSELQSRLHLVCRLLLEKKKKRSPTSSMLTSCLARTQPVV